MHKFLKKDNRMFSSYISDFFDKYDELNKYDTVDGVYEYLYKKLFMVAIRTLIYEMHVYKINGKLCGENAEERFCSFEKITETAEFKEYIQNKYPVLLTKMNELVSNTCDYVHEIYENFESDKNLLNEKIAVNIDKIENISIGEGDTHNGGKSIAIVYTNIGKIIYKPHSLACDYAFDRLLRWINGNGSKYNLESVKYVKGAKYGWQEYIEYEGKLSNQEAKEYYYKCGQFLGLFYILGSTDLHFENIIVHKNTPFFIDLETLVGIPKYINFSNILETNFIPGIHDNVVYDFDYSGLCGKGNVSSKIKSISIINPRTDEMRIENTESTIRENKNTVYVNGERVKIEDYKNDIIAGFEEMWNLIFSKKEEFIFLIDEIFGDDTLLYRQVLRATQVYSKFLTAATHPDYLCKEENQKILFDRLLLNVSDAKVVKRINDEISQLCNGDVPYYTVKYNDNGLYSDNGIVCRDYFEHTVRDGIVKRVINTISNNKVVQLDIIKKSLFTAYDKQFIEEGLFNQIDQGKYADKIAYEIYDKVVDDPTGTIMFINTLANDHFFLTNINLDMYEGGGIIWFLACYGQLKNALIILELALKLFDTAERCFDIHKESKNIRLSGFSGVGSIIYLSYNLFLLTNRYKYYECYKKYCNEVVNLMSKLEMESNDSSKYDFMCGISGLIIVLCKIYKNDCNNKLKDKIYELKKELLNYFDINTAYSTGITHGISGMAYAFIVLDKTFPELDYKASVISCLRQELDIYMSKKQYGLEWCHGISGLIFVRTIAYLQWHEVELKEQLTKLFMLIDTTDITKKNNCLCHGVRGVKESLSYVKKLLENDYSLEFDKIFSLEEYDFFGLNCHTIENFMMGTSGVAYSCLKSEFSILPSVMALELFNE